MDNNNISAKGRKRRGRPEKPLKVEIEFIDDSEARERWIKIFELLEAEASDQTVFRERDGADYEQLGLF